MLFAFFRLFFFRLALFQLFLFLLFLFHLAFFQYGSYDSAGIALYIKGDIDEIGEDPTYRRENEKANQELMSYLKKISECTYCPMKFTGTPSEKEKARSEHIKKEHPGATFIKYR